MPTSLQTLYKDNSIGIRCPDHPVASLLLRLVHLPVVAPSANYAGQPPATDADQVVSQLADDVDMILDGGPCKHKQSSTVALVDKDGVKLLREGVYAASDLQRMSKVTFLFVCTGNTCRSPMAEGFFRKYLAEKIGCGVDEVEERGYKVHFCGHDGYGRGPGERRVYPGLCSQRSRYRRSCKPTVDPISGGRQRWHFLYDTVAS